MFPKAKKTVTESECMWKHGRQQSFNKTQYPCRYPEHKQFQFANHTDSNVRIVTKSFFFISCIDRHNWNEYLGQCEVPDHLFGKPRRGKYRILYVYVDYDMAETFARKMIA